MTRNPRYDTLFEPVTLGPVTAPNRFYQSPQCNGMGRNYPGSFIEMRRIKAEGGWGVVFNEQCDFHYSTDNPRNIRLWDEQDLPLHETVVAGIHEHGALAGLMLAHNGYITPNVIGREIPWSPSGTASFGIAPSHARAMTLSDISTLRRRHRASALLAKRAGYDLVMVYAGHNLALPMHFLSRRHNQRSDQYGGSVENRMRLLKELIEDTKDAVGDACAVGVRFAVDELAGPDGISCDAEGREVVAQLAELPDYWDVNISGWAHDSVTSRFADEGHQEPYVSFVKQLTTKPVVGVGRFTSPDTMLGQIRRGVLDLIGAARPSIADPFLPRKIDEGREDDIRECIGCNICTSNNYLMAPIRCTQNPTMGEEWRRGWHPERIEKKNTDDDILIVGAGPAGLEAARVLGERGYAVTLAEASRDLGGRVSHECRLPGLAAWARVRDYRVAQIEKRNNVEVYLDSELTAANVIETGATLVAIATGCHWRRDGVGRQSTFPIDGWNRPTVLSPDDIMAGTECSGHVVVYEDDHYYMASIMAEQLVQQGCCVTLLTPAFTVARFTEFTLELLAIHKRMARLGVTIVANREIVAVEDGGLHSRDVYSRAIDQITCDAVVMVAGRQPDTRLVDSLAIAGAPLHRPRAHSIGDARGPGTIAAAVFSGHAFARNLSSEVHDEAPFRREDVCSSHELSVEVVKSPQT